MAGKPSSPRPKTATKTAVSPRTGSVIPLGAHPGNTGGKKGRSGRKSKDFLTRCLDAVEDPTLWAAARKKNAVSVLQLAASYAKGLPKQTTEHEGVITVKIVDESTTPDDAA